MANALYKKGKAALLGSVNMATDTIKVVPVDATYTVNLTTDEFLSDITAGKRVAPPVELTNKALTDGAFSADDTTIPAVSGAVITHFVVYKVGVSEAASPLLAVLDTVTGLPYTPVGNDIVLHWNAGAAKIFAI